MNKTLSLSLELYGLVEGSQASEHEIVSVCVSPLQVKDVPSENSVAFLIVLNLPRCCLLPLCSASPDSGPSLSFVNLSVAPASGPDS